MENITHKTAVQIINQKGTNSVPFTVLCGDSELYIAKTMFKSHPPFEDVINELLCVYFLELWGVSVIKPCLIKIPQLVFDQYIVSGGVVDDGYNGLDFNNTLFFGSEYNERRTEMELYNIQFRDKHQYNKFMNPNDMILIGIFDLWIANKDRRGSNPNLLIDENEVGKFEILPIDHTQAFAYQNNYKALNIAIMDGANSKTILKTAISKSILKFADSNFITNLDKIILDNINNTIDNIEFVFDQVPASFGLSKKGKAKIKSILSDKDRNLKISKLYLNYL